jgi:hypothetical protein
MWMIARNDVNPTARLTSHSQKIMMTISSALMALPFPMFCRKNNIKLWAFQEEYHQRIRPDRVSY